MNRRGDQHVSDDQRCSHCRFWIGVAQECHRHAPANAPEWPPRKWPTSYHDEWCGDFAPIDSASPIFNEPQKETMPQSTEPTYGRSPICEWLDRRHQLIQKRIAEGLGSDEESELKQLQERARLMADAIAPFNYKSFVIDSASPESPPQPSPQPIEQPRPSDGPGPE